MRIIIFSALKCCHPHHSDRCTAGPKQMLLTLCMTTDFHKTSASSQELSKKRSLLLTEPVWSGYCLLYNSIQRLSTFIVNTYSGGYILNELASDVPGQAYRDSRGPHPGWLHNEKQTSWPDGRQSKRQESWFSRHWELLGKPGNLVWEGTLRRKKTLA